MENIPRVSGNPAKVTQNHDARKAVSATVLASKYGGGIFQPRRWKPSVRSYYLSPFLCKPRPLAVSVGSRGLENIPHVPGNRAEVGQNHDGRKAVSATL